MAFKRLQVADGHWRRLHAAELVLLVRAGICFEDGVDASEVDGKIDGGSHAVSERRLSQDR